jgi:hypothetical protein
LQQTGLSVASLPLAPAAERGYVGRTGCNLMSQEFRVVIPDEVHTVVNFQQDGHPGVAVLNSALTDFNPRVVFRWHLSVMFQLKDLIEHGMPSLAERATLDPFGDRLDADLKGDVSRPNALFLARITWNASRELVYRVHDPEHANDLLQRLITSSSYPREFDFRMDDDPEWGLAAWHLGTAL